MRTSQFDQEKRIKILQSNYAELAHVKTQLEADFENVKNRLTDKEAEIIEIEQTLTREQDRERFNTDRRRELMERIEIMSQKSILLERHQQEMERELFNFVEENERIRRQLYNRDLEAERAKARNKQAITHSHFQLNKSRSPHSRKPSNNYNH